MATLGTMATYGIVDENKIIKEFDEWAGSVNELEDMKAKIVTCRYARLEPGKDMTRKEAEAKLNELYHSDPFTGMEKQLCLRVYYKKGVFFASVSEDTDPDETSYKNVRFNVIINNKNDFHQVIMFVLSCITNDPRTFR